MTILGSLMRKAGFSWTGAETAPEVLPPFYSDSELESIRHERRAGDDAATQAVRARGAHLNPGLVGVDLR